MLLDLLYPPKCLHCDALLQKHSLLCGICLDMFILLPQEGRCNKCFSEIASVEGTCKPCRQIAHPFVSLSSCFDSLGPGMSIGEALRGGQFHFSKDIASFLIVQLDRLQYPCFDLITVVPGYFRSPYSLVAKELSKMLQVPFKNLLKRGLTPHPSFSIQKKSNLINKKVLLLDIRMESRTTIREAGWALDKGLPESIYGMTFCC